MNRLLSSAIMSLYAGPIASTMPESPEDTSAMTEPSLTSSPAKRMADPSLSSPDAPAKRICSNNGLHSEISDQTMPSTSSHDRGWRSLSVPPQGQTQQPQNSLQPQMKRSQRAASAGHQLATDETLGLQQRPLLVKSYCPGHSMSAQPAQTKRTQTPAEGISSAGVPGDGGGAAIRSQSAMEIRRMSGTDHLTPGKRDESSDLFVQDADAAFENSGENAPIAKQEIIVIDDDDGSTMAPTIATGRATPTIATGRATPTDAGARTERMIDSQSYGAAPRSSVFASPPNRPIRPINFSKGRRGNRSLTQGLVAQPSSLKAGAAAEADKQKDTGIEDTLRRLHEEDTQTLAENRRREEGKAARNKIPKMTDELKDRRNAAALTPARNGPAGESTKYRTPPSTSINNNAAVIDLEYDGDVFDEDMAIDFQPQARAADANDAQVSRLPTPYSPQNDLSQRRTARPLGSYPCASAEKVPIGAKPGREGARKIGTEDRAVSIIVQEIMDTFQKRQEAAEREKTREKARERLEFAAQLEKMEKTLGLTMQKEVQAAVAQIPRGEPASTAGFDFLNPFLGQRGNASRAQATGGLREEPAPAEKQDGEGGKARKTGRGRTEKAAVKARERFKIELRRELEEQNRAVGPGEFNELLDAKMEERDRKLKLRRKQPNGSMPNESSQNNSPQHGDDSGENGSSTITPDAARSAEEKDPAGGIISRIRNFNTDAGNFEAAASTKVINDSDSSDESEEDPEYEERSSQTSGCSADGRQQASADEKPDETHSSVEEQRNGVAIIALPMPRHLQDKDMVYVYSVQRSEEIGDERSKPVVIKKFLDRDEANAFADDELRGTRWGPAKQVTEMTQTYSTETGLFSGFASINSGNEIHRVDVVPMARYTGSWEDFQNHSFKPRVEPRMYLIFLSTTRTAPINEADANDEYQPGREVDKSLELITAEANEAEDQLEAGDSKSNKAIQTNEDEDLFGEECDGEPADHATSAKQSIGEQMVASLPAFYLQETLRPLDTYTDRELANKRASEVFLEKIKPVGGDISLQAWYNNEFVPEVNRRLDEVNNAAGEMFEFSRAFEFSGHEIKVYVQEFEMKGPRN